MDTARREIGASIARFQLTRVASTSGEIHFDVCIGDDVECFGCFAFEGLEFRWWSLMLRKKIKIKFFARLGHNRGLAALQSPNPAACVCRV